MVKMGRNQVINAICKEANDHCLSPVDFLDRIKDEYKDYDISTIDFICDCNGTPYETYWVGISNWKNINLLTNSEIDTIYAQKERANRLSQVIREYFYLPDIEGYSWEQLERLYREGSR